MRAYTIEDINKRKPERSRLIAISFSDKRGGGGKLRYVNCVCQCGNMKTILLTEITLGGTISCGCAQTDELVKRNTKFSIKIPTHLYSCYHDMMYRCHDPESPNYRFYGANGVTVCEEWRKDPESFYRWALSNGWRKGLHLDKDIIGNGKLYSPQTCKFVTFEENYMARKPHGRDMNGRFCKL